MKKLTLLIIFIMSILVNLHAGYVTRGIYLYTPLDDLKNYTLTFCKDGVPVVAAAIHTSFASGSGRNSIAIVPADLTVPATVFPIAFFAGPDEYFDVEVLDFHYDWNSDTYVLCGSRIIQSVPRAFVAVINNDFSQMEFYEYIEADMFYSIWVDYPTSTGIDPGWDYYVCGTKDKLGVIASIDRTSMQCNNFFITEQDWEYHKIIAKQNTDYSISFVASGRDTEHKLIGITTLDPQFSSISAYEWEQGTESASHCVVAANVLPNSNNSVIVASSNYSTITLNPVTFPLILPAQIVAYQFNFNTWADNSFYVQDIGTIQTGSNIRISVAGNARLSSGFRAWHVYTVGALSGASTFVNNFYGSGVGKYEHYKIRYQQGEEYTGGYYQDNTTKRVLFGTPLKPADDCDNHYTSYITNTGHLNCSIFYLTDVKVEHHIPSTHESYNDYMNEIEECDVLKSVSPKFAILPPEKEDEITTFYDRITLKDTPTSTSYQIYNVVGQLMQLGTITSDISTSQLCKGVYILRLENGKTFKFVK